MVVLQGSEVARRALVTVAVVCVATEAWLETAAGWATLTVVQATTNSS